MYPFSVYTFIFNLVVKVKIFIKLWLQMSLRSLCLLFMRSLVLQILPCIPRCFHLLHDGTFLHVSILHPRHHSSWTDIPFVLGRFCINDVAAFVILFFILKCLTCSSKQVSSFFYCRWLCMRSFLQVKCICMVRNIS